MSLQPQSRPRQSVSRPYSRSPGGLLIPLHATLKGRVRWQVLDERGVPEVPRTPSGIPVGPVEGVEQPNLITNLGMDRFPTRNLFNLSPTQVPSYRKRLAVGTGSTAPDFTDTTLDNEVQRAQSSGTFSDGSNDYELDTDATPNVYRATSLVTRVVTMTADRNLTEFGLADDASGDILIRELLRDGGGTPITVSLLDGKTLRLDHTFYVELPAPEDGQQTTINVEEYDAGDNLVATIPYDVTYGSVINGVTATQLGGVFNAWNPATAVGRWRAIIKDPVTWDRNGMLNNDGHFSPSWGTGANMGALTQEVYTTGTYSRWERALADVGEGNHAWLGFIFAGSTSYTPGRGTGAAFIFTDPLTYTKQNTDTLRVGMVRSWARA